MGQSRRMLAQPLRELAFGGVGASFTPIGNPLSNQIRIIHIYNLTNVTLMFSFTGNTDHFRLPANGFLLLDLCCNKINDGGFFVSENTQMYVKQDGSAPTSGTVNVSAYYAYETARD